MKSGDPGRARTCDILLRRPKLTSMNQSTNCKTRQKKPKEINGRIVLRKTFARPKLTAATTV
jgi:hypothetical protein